MRRFTAKVRVDKMGTIFKHEWRLFWGDIKNKLLVALFLIGALIVGIFIESEYQFIRPVPRSSVESAQEDASRFIEEHTLADFPRAYTTNMGLLETTEKILAAYDNEDFRTVLREEPTFYIKRLDGYQGQDPNYFIYGMTETERHYLNVHDTLVTGHYFDQLIDGPFKLSEPIIHGKTVFQAITRYFTGYFPLIMLTFYILMSFDTFSKDHQHLTLVKTFPVRQYLYTWVKSLNSLTIWVIALIGVLLALGLSMVFYLPMGGINLPTPFVFDQDSAGYFILTGMIMLILLALVLNRIMAFLDTLGIGGAFNLLLIPFILMSELWHEPMSATQQPLINFALPSYFRVGDVISGYLAYWWESTLLNEGTMLFIILGYLLLIEMFHLLAGHFKDKSGFSH